MATIRGWHIHRTSRIRHTGHITSIDLHIKFTIDPEKRPFLDLCTHISTKVTIDRKPIHIDHHLNFKSHPPLTHKRSVVRTLTNRAQQLKRGNHVHSVLRNNGYPDWALAPPPPRAKRPPSTNNSPRRPVWGLPYVAGLSEQRGRAYKSYNVHVYHKPG